MRERPLLQVIFSWEQLAVMLFGIFSRCACRKSVTGCEHSYALEFHHDDPFSQVMQGVGSNSKGEENKKDGLKVNMLTDVHNTAVFAKNSEAKMHNKKFRGTLKGGGRFYENKKKKL
ncbi:MAG: hypothetical protein PWQ72_1222 [Pseudothermotoga sp.]|nr:hypothetical protein [Pseudothermotoga sp.]